MKKLLILTLSILGICTSYASNNNANSSAPHKTKMTANNQDTQNNSTEDNIIVNIECAEGSPCFVVKHTSAQVIDAIKQEMSPAKTTKAINRIVVPQFEFTLMTKYAMGNNWRLVKDDIKQQKQLVNLFQQLLVNTYATALTRFENAQITITSEEHDDDNKRAKVYSQVTIPNSANNQPVKVEYDLACIRNNWKAYDIKIEDISLVTTYKNQFNDIIQTSQVAGLIKQLKIKVDSLKNKSQPDNK